MATHKRYKLRTRFRTAPKVQEKQLVAAGKWLAQHPEALIPKCDDDCGRCTFPKLAAKLQKVAEFKDDSTILKKLAKRGDPLARAFAATILVATRDKAHYLSVAKGPDGEIAYYHLPEAKVQKEKLIGLQYFKDPHLRLLAYADISKKRRLTFYSTKESIFCTPLGGEPPQPFIQETMRRLSLSSRDGRNFTCTHHSDDIGYLEIDWKSAGISIEICESCLKDGRNIVARIGERMIDPGIEASFSERAKIRLKCLSKCEKCHSEQLYEFTSNDMNNYINGNLSDKGLYNLAVERFLDSLKNRDERVLVIGRKCFGQEDEALVQAIATDETERLAVELLAKKIGGAIVLSEGITTNKMLTRYWDEFGREIIRDITGGELSDEQLRLSDKDTPMNIIERAMARKRAGKIKSALPKYERLGPYSSFIDRLARHYKIEGKASAIKELELTGTEDTRQRSIGLAFGLALGNTGKEWQYTSEEIEYARHLSAEAAELLDAEGEEYDQLLRQFIGSAGVSEEIVRKK